MTTTIYNLIAPATGKCMPIEASHDMDLSTGMLGNGVSIIPTEGTVTAPCDCLITNVSPAHHAVVILDTAHDVEIMLCADTDIYTDPACTFFVQPGNVVKQGAPLFSCNVADIQKRGGHVTFSCILTNLPAADVSVMSGDVVSGKSHILSCECVG